MSLAVIAGSGLGDLAAALQVERTISFDDVPGVGAAGVAGHAGRILSGTIASRPCHMVMGRRHFYEGDERPIHHLIDYLAGAGATTLLITSAAGSLRRFHNPGDLVVIHDIVDHQNRRRFAAAGTVAREPATRGIKPDPNVTRRFERAAAAARVPWHRGTMLCTSGPLYETRADVELLQYADADVATMSGAPEVTRANAIGLPAVSVAVVTNPCTGINASVPSHSEVLEASGRAARGLARVVEQFIFLL
ncbi:MAG TPA: hypothetical protein VFH88_11910 [Candidatus Krumholzibacteria bacterium]|nr:hypothetical protein [Candidatus Krumholzibacteria bacterium]